MEIGPSTIGFEDGAIDVEHLLVEHKDRHVSLDSVMEMRDTSPDFGVMNADFAREREGVLDRDVLDSISNEVGVGYFRSQNEFCSMGGDYFLDVGFNESITNLDCGSNEGFLTWKADIFRIMDTSEFGEVPSPWHELQILPEQKSPNSPTCYLQDIGDFRDISSCNFHDTLPYGNISGPPPLVKMFRNPKNEKNDNFGPTDQNGGSIRCDLPRQKRLRKPVSNGNDTCHSSPVKKFCNPKNEKSDDYGPTGQNGGSKRLKSMKNREEYNGDLPIQKRSRKPTQRYIDELMDPISRYYKRRREVSCLTVRDKSVGVKDQKKCCVGSRYMAVLAEESSVVAIQVPFGSLVHKQCPNNPACEMVLSSDEGSSPITKSEDNFVTRHAQKRRNECTTALHLKKRNYHNLRSLSQKRSGHIITRTHANKSDDCLKTVMRKNRDDDCPTEDSLEEASVRRKNHRLWTIAEVKKLIDGVSEYGVGRWTHIKRIYFSAASHRTSVNLKDKWRNLLKASRLQLGNQQGEKKRNIAWRPLPKSILRRVCELANKYPYPRGPKRNNKIARRHHDSPDRSTTLGDYRRILRSTNGN